MLDVLKKNKQLKISFNRTIKKKKLRISNENNRRRKSQIEEKLLYEIQRTKINFFQNENIPYQNTRIEPISIPTLEQRKSSKRNFFVRRGQNGFAIFFIYPRKRSIIINHSDEMSSYDSGAVILSVFAKSV